MRERERLNIPLIRQGLRKFKDAFSLADKDERMSTRGKGETGEIYHSFIITASSLSFFGLGCLGECECVFGEPGACGPQTEQVERKLFFIPQT